MKNIDRDYNLQLIKNCRLKQGDVFTVHISDFYLFGRIVNDKIPMMGSEQSLVYIYNVRSATPSIDLELLTPDKLLLAPFIPFKILWTKGYASRVNHKSIQSSDLLTQHCFKMNNKYVDEYSREIKKANGQLCGNMGIIGLGIVDDLISDAIGIKKKPLLDSEIWYMSGQGEKIWLTKTIPELKKYINYEEIIKNYPEVVERE